MLPPEYYFKADQRFSLVICLLSLGACGYAPTAMVTMASDRHCNMLLRTYPESFQDTPCGLTANRPRYALSPHRHPGPTFDQQRSRSPSHPHCKADTHFPSCNCFKLWTDTISNHPRSTRFTQVHMQMCHIREFLSSLPRRAQMRLLATGRL